LAANVSLSLPYALELVMAYPPLLNTGSMFALDTGLSCLIYSYIGTMGIITWLL